MVDALGIEGQTADLVFLYDVSGQYVRQTDLATGTAAYYNFERNYRLSRNDEKKRWEIVEMTSTLSNSLTHQDNLLLAFANDMVACAAPLSLPPRWPPRLPLNLKLWCVGQTEYPEAIRALFYVYAIQDSRVVTFAPGVHMQVISQNGWCGVWIPLPPPLGL